MPIVAFYSKGASIEVQKKWENRLKLYLPSTKLVSLLSKESSHAICALLWKAPLKRLDQLKKLKGLISLGQGVDHILNESHISNNILVVRIVDPYMAKAMSHWVLLSVLNFTRDTFGYYNQEKTKTYQPRYEKDFLSIKIGVYGIGAIGSVVLKDLRSMGFDVNGWSRTKKKYQLY
jgi:glyoxylate/hydroxypyruvate reductase A